MLSVSTSEYPPAKSGDGLFISAFDISDSNNMRTDENKSLDEFISGKRIFRYAGAFSVNKTCRVTNTYCSFSIFLCRHSLSDFSRVVTYGPVRISVTYL